jgi:hypothetical protein
LDRTATANHPRLLLLPHSLPRLIDVFLQGRDVLRTETLGEISCGVQVRNECLNNRNSIQVHGQFELFRFTNSLESRLLKD